MLESKAMEYTRGHKVFRWLKVKYKLEYATDYDFFIMKDKKTTKHFIEELNQEIEANNHNIVFMLLSLGFDSRKITLNLETYWDFCYKNRNEYEYYRKVLIQFPEKPFKDRKNEIYKELGDIEFKQGIGNFIDVDYHLKKALVYYKKCKASDNIKECLSKLEKNKKNTEENYPKPIEFIIPIEKNNINSNEDYKLSSASITRVTRTSSNDLIYKKYNSCEMIEFQLIKHNIVAKFFNFFQKKEDVSFDDFLDYFNFKESWFYNADIYEIMLPALLHFHENYKIDFKENLQSKMIFMLNYVLPLDSLVLKFEGLIRLLLEKNGIDILIEKNGKTESNTFFNMLNLFETSIELKEFEKKQFIKVDKPFFNHIFGSEELNLRNEIAHSTFKKEYYSYEKVIYIIDAISRIGKYSVN